MEQNKDQSGAAVRGNVRSGCPCEPLGLDGAVCPDPKTGLPLCSSAECYSAKPGAAVRDEAVAGLPARRFVHVIGFLDADYIDFKAGEIFGGGVLNGVEYESKHYTRTVAEEFVAEGDWREVEVSARAVDAPSEPSEAMERIFESWDGCDYDGIDIGAALRADFKTFVFGKSRAADALDSQPSTDEPTDREALIACLGDDAATLSRINPDDEMAQTMREAAAMLENDGKALDSQATDSSMPVDMSQAKRWIVQLRGRVDTLLAIINEKAAASSQPTDGGVRNDVQN